MNFIDKEFHELEEKFKDRIDRVRKLEGNGKITTRQSVYAWHLLTLDMLIKKARICAGNGNFGKTRQMYYLIKGEIYGAADYNKVYRQGRKQMIHQIKRELVGTSYLVEMAGGLN